MSKAPHIPLGQLTRIQTGRLDANASSTDGQYPFFTCAINPLKIDSYSYDCECVLVAGNGDLNVKYFNGKFDAYQRTYIVESKDRHQLWVPYLFRFLDYYLDELRTQTRGGVIQYIRLGNLTEANIPLPPLEEQKKIAATLDAVSDLIRLRKRQLEELDLLVKARFVEMFSAFDLSSPDDGWKKISDLGTVVGGTTPKTNVAEYWGGEYRWITPAELVSDSSYIYDSVRKLTKAGVDSCSLQEMPKDTVILSSRAPIGKVAIAGNSFYCNQGFKNIICGKRILPRYLYALLLYNTEYLNTLGRGATFKEISKSIVDNIKIPVPNIDEQQQFADFVTQIDKSKVAALKALNIAQMLFDSLMQRYFWGLS